MWRTTCEGSRPLRPCVRARLLRRRVRRPSGRRGESRDARARSDRARQPRAPGRRGRRRSHRRRRGHDAPVAGRAVPRRDRRRAAAARQLRRRGLLPAPRCRARRSARAAPRRDGRGGGADGRRVARRPGRRAACRRVGRRDGSADPAALRRGCAGARGGRLRAQAVRDPSGGGARRRPGPRDPELLVPHRGLQGHADGAAAHGLLPRSTGRAHRLGAGSRALPLLDEHLPELGAGAPVPDDRAQRRDQHAAGQRQLDERARVAAGVRALRRRPRQDPAGRPPRRLRLGDVRQRARAARARGAVAAARDDDDDPGGLPGPRGHLARARRVLRLPPVPDGSLGRTGGDRVHRRARDRRDARSQRPAPGAVARDGGRLGDPRVRDRRARGGAGEHRAEGTAAAREAVPRRRGRRPDRPGRGSEADGCLAAPLRRVVPERGRTARGPAGAARTSPAPPSRCARVSLPSGTRRTT